MMDGRKKFLTNLWERSRIRKFAQGTQLGGRKRKVRGAGPDAEKALDSGGRAW